jgi:hypothetical protein
MTVWGLDEATALLLADVPATHADEAEIWSECHAELASHADRAFRGAGISIAVKNHDSETIDALTPSIEMNFLRMLRDIEAPQSRT